jgi:uncharacterized cupredoxin-like copper-binding protein
LKYILQTSFIALAMTVAFVASRDLAAADATISVSLTEFAVAPSASSAGPGVITFNVSNNGAIIHDFHVIQSNLAPDSLPVDPNTAQVDLAQVNEVSATQVIQSGGSDSTAPTLSAGAYVLICNVPGHYGGGMYAGFTIQQAPSNTPTGGGGGPTPSDGTGGNGGTGGTDDGGTGGTDGGTGGAADAPATGYGPGEERSANAWWLALPAMATVLFFGALAFRVRTSR